MSDSPNSRLEEKVDKLGTNMQAMQVDMASLKSSNEGVIAVMKATTEGNIKMLTQRVEMLESYIARINIMLCTILATIIGSAVCFFIFGRPK